MTGLIILMQVLLWVHIMSLAGAFGSLLVVQVGLPRDVRDSAAGARVGPHLTAWMLAVGFVAGLALVLLRFKLTGGTPGAHFLGVVGIKFLLLLAAGALIGIGARKLRSGFVYTASRMRVAAMVALALAALLGVTIP